jgi:hypothetical protein
MGKHHYFQNGRFFTMWLTYKCPIRMMMKKKRRRRMMDL